MTVIQLLNKIANGEELRFTIIEADETYKIRKGEILDSETFGDGVQWYIDEKWLNMEVKIIEEDNKIEKLTFGDVDGTPRANENDIIDKINEIIDKINKTEE